MPQEPQQSWTWELGLQQGPNPRGLLMCLPGSAAPLAMSAPLSPSHTRSVPWLALCGKGTCQDPPTASSPPSCSGRPCPLADSGLRPRCCSGGLAGTGTTLCPCPVPSLRGHVPALCPGWVLPQLAMGLQGGITLIFLNKIKYLSLRARISFPAPCGRQGLGDRPVPALWA